MTGFIMLFKLERKGYFWVGFFSGFLWFYWIGFSFIYYNMTFAVPFVWIGISLIYGLIFLAASYPSFMILRAILVLVFSYIHPFGFNWFNLEATLILGPFEPNLRGIISIISAALIFNLLKGKIKIISILITLIFGIQYTQKEPNLIPFSTELTSTQISQDRRWEIQNRNKIINQSLNIIQNAIENKKSLVVLPESAIPTFINKDPNLIQILKNLSKNITIITGGLGIENEINYNSAYLFNNQTIKRADKFILVPFGEEIPLPEFAKSIINNLFFDGAKDFGKAKGVSDFIINDIKIRMAICYEATKKELFYGNPKIMIAISNNSWFKPNFKINGYSLSTESQLQSLLLKYFATKYGTTIYHSVNGSKSEIIIPKQRMLNFNF